MRNMRNIDPGFPEALNGNVIHTGGKENNSTDNMTLIRDRGQGDGLFWT